LEFERQLDRAGTADLIKRIEAAVRPAGAQTAGQRLRRVTEERAGQGVVGWTKVRVVEDVEELTSEAELRSLREVKFSAFGLTKTLLPAS